MGRASAPFYGTLRALCVEDRCRRTGVAPGALAALDVKRVVNAGDGAVPLPEIEVVPNGATRREIGRDGVHWQPVEST